MSDLRLRLWYARLETYHFSFEVVEMTRERAEEAMRRGWAAHREDVARGRPGLDDGAAPWSEFAEDVNYTEMTVGEVHRDRCPIPNQNLKEAS